MNRQQLTGNPYINFWGNNTASTGYKGTLLITELESKNTKRKTGFFTQVGHFIVPIVGDCLEYSFEKEKRAFHVFEDMDSRFTLFELDRHTDLHGRSFLMIKPQVYRRDRDNNPIQYCDFLYLTFKEMINKEKFPGKWKYTDLPLILE